MPSRCLLNHVNRTVASVFLWNKSFWSKCWVHGSFLAEAVKSLFPTFLESVSSTHSHALFLWGCHFAERLSACIREREKEPLLWCRPAFLGPAILNSSSVCLSPSLYIYVYLFLSYRATVSAFCSLLVWLVMSPFSFCSSLCPPHSSWLKFSL